MQRKKAFTLLELLVVVSLIALVITVIIVVVSSARAKGRDARRISDIREINNAIVLYQSDHQGNPPDLGQSNCGSLHIYDSTCFASTGQGAENWEMLKKQLSPYLKILPSDPCPTCTAAVFFRRVFAYSDDYEYIYHAPAGVFAYLVNHNIDPNSAGLASQPYSIYAKRLEATGISYGFGLSLPTVQDLEENIGECPYTNLPDDEMYCQLWNLCEVENNQDACVVLDDKGPCPYLNNQYGEEICLNYWPQCHDGNQEYCEKIQRYLNN